MPVTAGRARASTEPTASPAAPVSRGTAWPHLLRQRSAVPLIVVTVALVVAGVAVGVAQAHQSAPVSRAQRSAPNDTQTNLLFDLTHVSDSVSATVGSGGVAATFTALAGAPALVDTGGKPTVLAVESQPCTGCAAQRWSLLIALSRFGTISNLPLLALPQSGSTPALATFSLDGMHYASSYVSFIGAELKDIGGNALQTLQAEGAQLLQTYDAPPYVPAGTNGFIPWVDIGNRYAMQGSGFAPVLMGNLDWGHVVTRLSNPGDPITRAIVGEANQVTAAICSATSMQPASACERSPIPALVAQLPAAKPGSSQP